MTTKKRKYRSDCNKSVHVRSRTLHYHHKSASLPSHFDKKQCRILSVVCCWAMALLITPNSSSVVYCMSLGNHQTVLITNTTNTSTTAVTTPANIRDRISVVDGGDVGVPSKGHVSSTSSFVSSLSTLSCGPNRTIGDSGVAVSGDDGIVRSAHSSHQVKSNKWLDNWRIKRNSLFGHKRTNMNIHHGLYKPIQNNSLLQHYLESTSANPNYWIADRYHDNVVCLLATFSGIVRVRPANGTFRGGSFLISPQDSLGRRANCERNSRNIFWKFSQHDEREIVPEDDDDDDDESASSTVVGSPKPSDNEHVSDGRSNKSSRKRLPKLVIVERSNRLLSAGFHVVGSVIEFHIAYIECLQKATKNTHTKRYKILEDSVCTNLSVSFDLGSFGDRLAYECSHIWSKYLLTRVITALLTTIYYPGKTLKDVHYNHNKRHYSGEVQISLKMVRIDKDPLGSPPYSFRRLRRRCAWDTLLSWQALTITGSLIVIFIVGFFGLCVCSNSSCHDETDITTNWCCNWWCCCNCCRKRSQQAHARVEYRRQVDPNRANCNHHYRHNHTQAPPPPSSSTSLLTNTSSHPNHVPYTNRRPNFSNSYSYEGTGSNPTQPSSSSALSTAIEDYYYYGKPNQIEPIRMVLVKQTISVQRSLLTNIKLTIEPTIINKTSNAIVNMVHVMYHLLVKINYQLLYLYCFKVFDQITQYAVQQYQQGVSPPYITNIFRWHVDPIT